MAPLWLCYWALTGKHNGTLLTLPTSTSFVIMTMLKQFSCHTIRQKSYSVSCLGPGGRGSEGERKGGKKQKEADRSNNSVKVRLAITDGFLFSTPLVKIWHSRDLTDVTGGTKLSDQQSQYTHWVLQADGKMDDWWHIQITMKEGGSWCLTAHIRTSRVFQQRNTPGNQAQSRYGWLPEKPASEPWQLILGTMIECRSLLK